VADDLASGSWLVGAEMTALQRRGLDAATRIVERLVATTDGTGDGRAGGDAAAPWPGALALPSTVEVVGLWRDLVQALPTGRGDGPAGGGNSGTGGTAGAAARLVVGSRAGAVTTRVWLHNGTVRRHVDVRLRCDELRDHAGASFPGTVRFAPDVLPELAPSASRPVDVTATVAGVRAVAGGGLFRGTIQVAGIPEAWLPIEVVVRA
jgi:hypothetical protein